MSDNIIMLDEARKNKNGLRFVGEKEVDSYKVNEKKMDVVNTIDELLAELFTIEDAPLFEIISDGFASDTGDMIACIKISAPVELFFGKAKNIVAEIIKLADYVYISSSADDDSFLIVLIVDDVLTLK